MHQKMSPFAQKSGGVVVGEGRGVTQINISIYKPLPCVVNKLDETPY